MMSKAERDAIRFYRQLAGADQAIEMLAAVLREVLPTMDWEDGQSPPDRSDDEERLLTAINKAIELAISAKANIATALTQIRKETE